TATYALGCFPLRTVAFRGHGFSLLENFTLRGLQTRALPAGVNGPPLQTNIVIVKASYTVLLSNTLAKEIHEDSSGKAKTMRPHSERSLRVRRLIASPRKA